MNEKSLDTLSVLSDRTLCASPEPLEPRIRAPPNPIPPITYRRRAPPQAYAVRASARVVAGVAVVLWSLNLSLSLVEYFRLLREPQIQKDRQFQLRVLLVWAVCSALLSLTASTVFVCTLLRRPAPRLVRFLRGFTIFMSFTSCIVGFAILFPAISECSSSTGCTGSEHALRVFVCGGVPVASVWTWVWIPTMRKFAGALEEIHK
ncbi:hypothetical protein K438DRAFT_1959420 [Mycena galopus ATCC 62051]|nr:hypothetical protein K438DRAFT_1959420 [Mycena galopus ATCC 62051]